MPQPFPNRRGRLALLVMGALMGLMTGTGQGAIPASVAQSGSVADMIEVVLPAVVNISTRTVVESSRNPLLDDPFFRYFFDIPERQPRERARRSLGSGVVIDPNKGHIVTNYHVVEGADAITVTLRDQRAFPAQVIGVDPATDLALLRIKARSLQALPLADSDQLRVGDFVVAVGNPFGLGQTVTSGIVSALGRSGLGIEGYEDFIQTDASINPGNSGGPLVNMAGELVGINTAIVGPNGANIGIGFAIPSNMAEAIVDQLIRFGEVRRGRLGVSVQDLNPELARAFGLQRWNGAVIAAVETRSPASKAGLRRGDVVTAVNGKPVRTSEQLRNAVGILPIGTTLELEIIRDGRSRKIEVTIGEFDDRRTRGDAHDQDGAGDWARGSPAGGSEPAHRPQRIPGIGRRHPVPGSAGT
jgi:serine protease Do/serine protease DegQ